MKYATRILVCVIAVSKSQEFLLKVRRLFIFFFDDKSMFFQRRPVLAALFTRWKTTQFCHHYVRKCQVVSYWCWNIRSFMVVRLCSCSLVAYIFRSLYFSGPGKALGCVCVSMQTITFERNYLDIWPAGSSTWKVKVKGQSSRSQNERRSPCDCQCTLRGETKWQRLKADTNLKL